MSAKCDGSGNYIRRDISAAAISNTAAWTMALWVKRTTDTNTYSFAAALHNDLILNNGQRATLLTDSGGDGISGYVNGSGAGGSVTLTTNSWFYLAITSTGSTHGDTYYYSAVGAPSMTNGGGPVAAHSSVFNYFTIAAGEDASLPIRGEFCHARLWTAALSAAELLSERDSLTPVRSSNLYLSWRLETGSDTTDQSGNGRSPSFTGTVTTGSDEPIAAAGDPEGRLVGGKLLGGGLLIGGVLIN